MKKKWAMYFLSVQCHGLGVVKMAYKSDVLLGVTGKIRYGMGIVTAFPTQPLLCGFGHSSFKESKLLSREKGTRLVISDTGPSHSAGKLSQGNGRDTTLCVREHSRERGEKLMAAVIANMSSIEWFL